MGARDLFWRGPITRKTGLAQVLLISVFAWSSSNAKAGDLPASLIGKTLVAQVSGQSCLYQSSTPDGPPVKGSCAPETRGFKVTFLRSKIILERTEAKIGENSRTRTTQQATSHEGELFILGKLMNIRSMTDGEAADEFYADYVKKGVGANVVALTHEAIIKDGYVFLLWHFQTEEYPRAGYKVGAISNLQLGFKATSNGCTIKPSAVNTSVFYFDDQHLDLRVSEFETTLCSLQN